MSSPYTWRIRAAGVIAGYAGTRWLTGRLPFFAALGLFGAVCGVVLTSAGSFARTRLAAGDGSEIRDSEGP